VRKSQNRQPESDRITTQRKTTFKEETIMKYVCDVCGWEYDESVGYPEGGIAPGTKWEDLPEDFACPLCSVGKDMFSEE
jgi:rubredoxin-NAD+ reductase